VIDAGVLEDVRRCVDRREQVIAVAGRECAALFGDRVHLQTGRAKHGLRCLRVQRVHLLDGVPCRLLEVANTSVDADVWLVQLIWEDFVPPVDVHVALWEVDADPKDLVLVVFGLVLGSGDAEDICLEVVCIFLGAATVVRGLGRLRRSVVIGPGAWEGVESSLPDPLEKDCFPGSPDPSTSIALLRVSQS